MNSTCPKCGFEQPPDRFCANCGIDMKAFASTIKSNKNFLGAGFFYIVLAAFVVGASIYFFSKQKDIISLEELSLLKSQNKPPSQVASPIHNRTAVSNEAPPPNSEASSDTQPTTLAEQADAIAKTQGLSFSTKEQEVLNSAKQEISGETLSAASPPKAIEAKRHKLIIKYAEIGYDYVRDFTNQPTRNTPGFILLSDPNRWSTYQQWIQQGAQSSYIRILDSQTHDIKNNEQNIIEITKPIGEFRTDNRAGLYIQVIVAQQGEFEVLRLNGRRVLQSNADPRVPLEILPFAEEIDITPNMALAFHAFLPHRRAFESEERYFNSDRIFRVFLSQSFINNTSDLFIIFEYTN